MLKALRDQILHLARELPEDAELAEAEVTIVGPTYSLTPAQLAELLTPKVDGPHEPITGGVISQRCPHCGREI